jgi:membrane-bound metal-dependent hydrolase YbcI (DUF457 family)
VKGIAHFVSGVAAATCIPQIVHMSGEGSLILLLAGMGGIVPDALDFKLARYLEKPDVEIDPDPKAPDPQAMAEQVAAALHRAYDAEKPVYVRFHTAKLGADLWRRYSIEFGREVRVHIGPVVTTSRAPFPGSELDLPVGRAPLAISTRYAYESETRVDVLCGPSLAFTRRQDAVEIAFLPWHRRWSHSLTLAALLGGLIAMVFGPWHGLAYALGAVVHILEDQLGYMGSNLLYPFTRSRTTGLRLFHSGDALPNLFAVWSSVWLVLVNVDRFSVSPALDPWGGLLVGLVLPWAVILGLAWWGGRKGRAGPSMGDAKVGDVLAEMEEIEC